MKSVVFVDLGQCSLQVEMFNEKRCVKFDVNYVVLFYVEVCCSLIQVPK